METDDPISKLALWQFSLDYEDLPFREETKPANNGIYRSKMSKFVYVYHEDSDQWDCFIPA